MKQCEVRAMDVAGPTSCVSVDFVRVFIDSTASFTATAQTISTSQSNSSTVHGIKQRQ